MNQKITLHREIERKKQSFPSELVFTLITRINPKGNRCLLWEFSRISIIKGAFFIISRQNTAGKEIILHSISNKRVPRLWLHYIPDRVWGRAEPRCTPRGRSRSRRRTASGATGPSLDDEGGGLHPWLLRQGDAGTSPRGPAAFYHSRLLTGAILQTGAGIPCGRCWRWAGILAVPSSSGTGGGPSGPHGGTCSSGTLCCFSKTKREKLIRESPSSPRMTQMGGV